MGLAAALLLWLRREREKKRGAILVGCGRGLVTSPHQTPGEMEECAQSWVNSGWATVLLHCLKLSLTPGSYGFSNLKRKKRDEELSFALGLKVVECVSPVPAQLSKTASTDRGVLTTFYQK